MNYNNIMKSLQNAMKTGWQPTGFPVFFQNTQEKRKDGDIFARFDVQMPVSNFASIGTKAYNISGYVSISIFVPLYSGTNTITDLSDKAAAIFSGLQINEDFGSIEFSPAKIQQSSELKNVMHAIVRIDFTFRPACT